MEQKWNRRATSVNRTYYYRLDEREVALESTNLANRGTPLGPNGMVTNHHYTAEWEVRVQAGKTSPVEVL